MGFFSKALDGAAFVGQFIFPDGALGATGGQWKSGFAAAKALISGDTQDAIAGGVGLAAKTALEYANPGGGNTNTMLGEVAEQGVRYWPKIKSFFSDMSFSGMAIGLVAVVAIGYFFRDSLKAIFNKLTGSGKSADATPGVAVNEQGVQLDGKEVTLKDVRVDQQKLADLGLKIGATGDVVDADHPQQVVTNANFKPVVAENLKTGNARTAPLPAH